jgi:hypothetical protein
MHNQKGDGGYLVKACIFYNFVLNGKLEFFKFRFEVLTVFEVFVYSV